MEHPIRELHLFAGAGGGILGGLLLGHVPVCAVELDKYCRSVLLQRQRDGILPWFPIWDDVRTFDGHPWTGRVDLICGGFPCQDISAAGKGAGIDGARSGLWSEFARIIGEVGPRFVFVENSPMLVNRGLGRVLGDLAALGFDAQWGVLGAHHAGAPHRRDRIWLLGWNTDRNHERALSGVRRWSVTDSIGDSEDVAHALGDGRQERRPKQHGIEGRPSAICCGPSLPIPCGTGLEKREGSPGEQRAHPTTAGGDWWATEPAVGRVAHGVARRVDRLKAIGNGQVPRVAELAWETLMRRVNES